MGPKTKNLCRFSMKTRWLDITPLLQKHFIGFKSYFCKHKKTTYLKCIILFMFLILIKDKYGLFRFFIAPFKLQQKNVLAIKRI